MNALDQDFNVAGGGKSPEWLAAHAALIRYELAHKEWMNTVVWTPEAKARRTAMDAAHAEYETVAAKIK